MCQICRGEPGWFATAFFSNRLAMSTGCIRVRHGRPAVSGGRVTVNHLHEVAAYRHVARQAYLLAQTVAALLYRLHLAERQLGYFLRRWKSHATLTLLAKQDCPLWLQYD